MQEIISPATPPAPANNAGLNRNFVFVLVGLVVGVGAIVAAVAVPKMVSPPAAPSTFPTPLAAPTLDESHRNSQQQDQFIMSTIKPTTPVVVGAPASLCSSSVNNEPEILVGYAPANGQSVGVGGQIKVWVNDEGAPIIAPGEQVNASTGQITTPGDRTAKAPDGYLWEPALYIAPQTAETGGTPHFPTIMRGDINNIDVHSKTARSTVAPIEPPPPGTSQPEPYTAEFIWDVNSLGLTAGTYQAEFVIHDGDDDRGVGCVSITII